MTPKQQHFADEWLIDHNGQRAYRVAYPNIKKDSTARVCASQLLTKPNVKAYIESRQQEIAAKYRITQERVLEEEALISFSNLAAIFKGGTLLPPEDLPEEVQRAISSIEVKELPDGSIEYKYRLWDKGASLKRISQHLGLYEADNKQKNPPIEEVYAATESHDPELAKATKKYLEENAT